MNLNELREKIDNIDSEIMILLQERASLAIEIGKIKQSQNLPVFNQKREQTILKEIQLKNEGPLSDTAIQNIFEVIISECRNIQKNK